MAPDSQRVTAPTNVRLHRVIAKATDDVWALDMRFEDKARIFRWDGLTWEIFTGWSYSIFLATTVKSMYQIFWFCRKIPFGLSDGGLRPVILRGGIGIGTGLCGMILNRPPHDPSQKFRRNVR